MYIDVVCWFDDSGTELCKNYKISWLDLKKEISNLLKENEILLDETIFEPSRSNTAIIQPLAGSIKVRGDGSAKTDYRLIELFNTSAIRRAFIAIDRVTVGVIYPPPCSLIR
ncbi:MAG: hypothetical protein K0S67_1675 [Nitrososphaeraceae archaeon]|jgi:hypothetical protein|nr:hypothetical protein [Nitrososphaeraceae archaeon]MDF2768812.1 hypothetical protein [Nitrososphaeraceae archaeon]